MHSVSRRRFLRLASLSPVALAVPGVAAQDPIPPPQSCPAPRIMATAGVAAGQALRVSLFRHLDPQFPSDPEHFKIEVVGLGGELLGFHEGSVGAGQGAFADFDVRKGVKHRQRVQVHVNVTVPTGHPVGATAEVFDLQTGETRYPRGPCVEPAQPVLAMGTVGIVRSQIVCLSLFHHLDPQEAVHPCLFKLALFGLDGKLLASDTGQLLTGQGAAFDYDLAKAAGLKHRERLQFHGDVWVEHPGDVGSVLEIVDRQTGETRYLSDPCEMPL